jgi:hypothetical protein
MPRKPSVSARVTAYRLECELDPTAAIRETYLNRDNFSAAILSSGMRANTGYAFPPERRLLAESDTPHAGTRQRGPGPPRV